MGLAAPNTSVQEWRWRRMEGEQMKPPTSVQETSDTAVSRGLDRKRRETENKDKKFVVSLTVVYLSVRLYTY